MVDLFAGSGALGIEALSRGAAAVTFVDQDRAAVAAIRANLAATGLAEPGGTVVSSDAGAGWPGPSVRPGAVRSALRLPGWPDLLAALAPLTRLAVLESGGPMDLGPAWEALKMKRYGGTVVTVVRPALPPVRLTVSPTRTKVAREDRPVPGVVRPVSQRPSRDRRDRRRTCSTIRGRAHAQPPEGRAALLPRRAPRDDRRVGAHLPNVTLELVLQPRRRPGPRARAPT